MVRSFATVLLTVGILAGAIAPTDAKTKPVTKSIFAAASTGSLMASADSTVGSEAVIVTSPDLAMWSSEPPVEGPKPAAPAASPAVSRALADGSMRRFANRIFKHTSSIAANLTRSAMQFIGTPYVFGGTSPSGFDCSGYVQHVFAMLGIHLPRTADAQYYAGTKTAHPVTGDLVFFQTYEPGPSHVGIYVGNGKFVHSSSHGVMVSRLADRYWAARYLGAKRVALR